MTTTAAANFSGQNSTVSNLETSNNVYFAVAVVLPFVYYVYREIRHTNTKKKLNIFEWCLCLGPAIMFHVLLFFMSVIIRCCGGQLTTDPFAKCANVEQSSEMFGFKDIAPQGKVMARGSQLNVIQQNPNVIFCLSGEKQQNKFSRCWFRKGC